MLGPRSMSMLRDMKMHDPSPLVRQDHQDETYFVGHRGYDKEVKRDQVFNVVAQEGLPRGGWRLPRPHSMLFHRRLGDLKAQLA
jgi:hypothetical protein